VQQTLKKMQPHARERYAGPEPAMKDTPDPAWHSRSTEYSYNIRVSASLAASTATEFLPRAVAHAGIH
jgi:hypothetical protein